MDEENENLWYVFMFEFFGEKKCYISEEKMAQPQVDAVFDRTRFEFDLRDLGVGLVYSRNFLLGAYGFSNRKKCLEFKKRVEHGEIPMDIISEYL